MMERYNKEHIAVYNTIQIYRWDRYEFLKKSHEKAKEKKFILGIKLVRGAYMEKERARAEEYGYKSPIQPDKAASDSDYNLALSYCLENVSEIALVAGTHNENSALLLTELMDKHNVLPDNKMVYFAQLYGMSDHISYNLSNAGYNVAKYVPYGPVREVLPYLIRRADENTSVAGQTSRELTLIMKEKKRRKEAR
jgi:proline dehydrogenase